MKTILHCDANNFFASVSIKLNPSLEGKCVAVTGDPDRRHGIILAKNEAAKRYGVKTGDTIWQAMRKCPMLKLAPAEYDAYVEFSDKLFELYTQYTDRVEPFGIDECWLDVTHSERLFGDGARIADELRRRARDEIGLTISVGVAFGKIFAKLGSDLKKPDATTVITPQNYKDTVWPLPVGDLLMVGRQTQRKLNAVGIDTIGDLARCDSRVLQKMLGINGLKLWESACGGGDDEVRLYYEKPLPKSVGNSSTLPKDIKTYSEVEAVVVALSELVCVRMRRKGLAAGGVYLGIKYSDLTCDGSGRMLKGAVTSASDICATALEIFGERHSFEKNLPVRGLAVSAYALVPAAAPRQLSLFDDEEKDEKKRRLERTTDTLRAKYGYNVIQSGSVLMHPYICEDVFDSKFVPFKK